VTAIAVRAGRRRRRPLLDTLLLALVWWLPTGAQVIEKTNAGFWRDATALLPGVERATWWARLADVKRAAVRWWALVFVVLVSWAALAPSGAAIVRAVAWPAFGAAAVAAYLLASDFDRRVRRPMYLALVGLIGLPPVDPHRKWLKLPRRVFDMDAEDARIKIMLPDDFIRARQCAGRQADDDDPRHAITTLVNERIPGEWETKKWQLQRARFFVEVGRKPAPPAKVLYADVKRMFDAPAHLLPLGLGTRAEEIYADLDHHTPHIAMSCGTGAGKSTLIRAMIAKRVRDAVRAGEEYRVVIIDSSGVGFPEFDGVPGVEQYLGSNDDELVAEWQAIGDFRAEMERRTAIYRQDRNATFPRWLLVIEEGNDFSSASRNFWKRIKEKSDPATPPVADDLLAVSRKARKVKGHIIAAYQRLDAKAALEPDIRDGYGMKILGRWTLQVWAFLVGTYPRPKSSKHEGRVLVVIGDEHKACQGVLMVEEEAREMALAGRDPVTVRPSATAGASHDGRTVRPGSPLRVIRGDGAGDPENASNITDESPAEIVGLDGGAAYLKLSRAAFEKARQRRPISGEYRKGNQPAWTPEALDEWNDSRPGKRRA
jgi:hypothetical protein